MTGSDPAPRRPRPPSFTDLEQPPPESERGRYLIIAGICTAVLVAIAVPVGYFVTHDQPAPRYTPEPAHNVTYWFTTSGGVDSLQLEMQFNDEHGDATEYAPSLTPAWRKDVRSNQAVDYLQLIVEPAGLDGRHDVTIGPIPPDFTVSCGIDVDGRSAASQKKQGACSVGFSLPVKSLGPSALAPTTGS
jgi:hypothetical protein